MKDEMNDIEHLSSMKLFCGSPFWNQSLTWNSTQPQFTPCFEKTILPGVPGLFICLFFGVDLICTKRKRYFSWNSTAVAKLVPVCVALVYWMCLSFYTLVFDQQGCYVVDVLNPFLHLITFMIVALLIIKNSMNKGKHSWVFFMFWMLYTVCGLPPLLTAGNGSCERYSHSYLYFYAIPIISLTLQCFEQGDRSRRQCNDIEHHVLDCENTKNSSPEKCLSIISKLTFSWVWNLPLLRIKKNNGESLQIEDLWKLEEKSTSKYTFENYKMYSNSTVKVSYRLLRCFIPSNRRDCSEETRMNKASGQKSIIYPLANSFKLSFLSAASLKCLYIFLLIGNPIIQEKLLFTLQDNPVSSNVNTTEGSSPLTSREPTWHSSFFSGLLFLNLSLLTLFLNYQDYIVCKIRLRVQSTLLAVLFRKVLTLHLSNLSWSLPGNLVTLCAVDVRRVSEVVSHLNNIWSAIFQIVLTLCMLLNYLGTKPVMVGTGVILVFTLITLWLANNIKVLQEHQMKIKDNRIGIIMNEIIQFLKEIKINCDEETIEKNLLDEREKESEILKKISMRQAASSCLWNFAIFVGPLVMCWVYINDGNALFVPQVLAILLLVYYIRNSLRSIGPAWIAITQCGISLSRIDEFLQSEEVQKNAKLQKNVSKEPEGIDPVVVKNGFFSLKKCCRDKEKCCEENATLKNINISVGQNQLHAIVGPGGSGKTTFLAAILGEAYNVSGDVAIQGTKAFVAQNPLVMNASRLKNIVEDSCTTNVIKEIQDVNEESSEQETPLNVTGVRWDDLWNIIEACALRLDLIKDKVDLMEIISEQGENLSRGQKTRVALARAVYSNADIVILDEPLSSLDASTASHIIKNVLGPEGLLKEKVRIVTTDSLAHLDSFHNIHILKKDGRIQTMTVDETDVLQNHLNGMVGLPPQLNVMEEVNLNTKINEVCSPSQQLQKTPNQNYVTQRIYSGNQECNEPVSHYNGVISLYWNMLCSRFGFAILVVLLHFALQFFNFMLLAAFHSMKKDENIGNHLQNETIPTAVYVVGYSIMGFCSCLCEFSAEALIYWILLVASFKLHKSFVHHILNAKWTSLQNNPNGNLITRFTQDIDILDCTLPYTFQDFLQKLFLVLAVFTVICSIFTWHSLIFVPIIAFYTFFLILFIKTTRCLRKMESDSCSDIYSKLIEAHLGAVTIRAGCAQDRFVREFENKVDIKQRVSYALIATNTCLAMGIEVLGNLFVLFTALAAVHIDASSGFAPLAVEYSLQIVDALRACVTVGVDLLTDIVSVERIKQYNKIIPEEEVNQDFLIPEDKNWPAEGKIEFKNICVRFRDSCPLVLKDLTLTINPHEKICLVGRSGAGKSTLALTLMRLLDTENDSLIKIDNIDISKLELKMLRSKITIIPQEPTLRHGTLRTNLDPKNKYEEKELINALKAVGHKFSSKNPNEDLEMKINHYSYNLSYSQRQLVHLARAILRKTRILVLDEAINFTDHESYKKLNELLENYFKDCTVIVITHKLQIIETFKRIVVIQDGEVKEVGNSVDLAQDKTSVFYSTAMIQKLIDYP